MEDVVHVERDGRVVVDLRGEHVLVDEVHEALLVGGEHLDTGVPELRERHLYVVHGHHRVVPLPVEVVPVELQLTQYGIK